MYQSKAQDLRIDKMCLFQQYDDRQRNYKPVGDMCFSLIFDIGYFPSYFILLEVISMTAIKNKRVIAMNSNGKINRAIYLTDNVVSYEMSNCKESYHFLKNLANTEGLHSKENSLSYMLSAYPLRLHDVKINSSLR